MLLLEVEELLRRYEADEELPEGSAVAELARKQTNTKTRHVDVLDVDKIKIEPNKHRTEKA